MAMKKFINDPKNLTKELLEGFAIAHGDIVTVTVREDRLPRPAQAGRTRSRSSRSAAPATSRR